MDRRWVAALMLLPLFLDLLPSMIGKAFSRLTGWQPVGKPVRLAFTEGALYEQEITGRVEQALSEIVTAGPDGSTTLHEISLVISLDRPLMYASRSVSRVVAVPRFAGHGPYRLPVTWSAVNVHALNAASPEPPTVVQYEDMIAICLLKLARTEASGARGSP